MLLFRSLLFLVVLPLSSALQSNSTANGTLSLHPSNSSSVLSSITASSSNARGTSLSSESASGTSSIPGTSSSSSSSSGNSTNGIGHYVLLGLGATAAEDAHTSTSTNNITGPSTLPVTSQNVSASTSSHAFVASGARPVFALGNSTGEATRLQYNSTSPTLALNGTGVEPGPTAGIHTNGTATTTIAPFLNSSIAPTGTGSLYASRCNALWSAYTSSSEGYGVEVITTTSWFNYTKWTAQTTNLGGCDNHVRLVGSFTPTASGINSTVYPIGTQAGFTQTTPACSVNPSDCENLFDAFSSSMNASSSAYVAAQTNVTLALYATALTIGTETTSFATTRMETPPIITIDSTTLTGSISTMTWPDSTTTSVDVYTLYSINQNEALVDNSSITWYGDVPAKYDSIMSPVCNRSVSEESCGACTIYGGQVQLMYFPVPANASRNMCTSEPPAATTCPLGPTTAPYTPASVDIGGVCESYIGCPYQLNTTRTANSGPYIVSQGMTFYENRAYISLQTAYASNSCGTVGKPQAGSVITLASSQVYSVRERLVYQCADYGYSFDFADLNDPLPFSAYNTMQNSPGCYPPDGLEFPDWMHSDWINGEQLMYTQPCDTIIDWAYRPWLVVPTQIRSLDPAWATCAVELEGLYDPPKALSAASTIAGVSEPGVQTTTSASPAGGPTTSGPKATAATTSTPATPVPEESSPAAKTNTPTSSTPAGEPKAPTSPSQAANPSSTGGNSDPGASGSPGTNKSPASQPAGDSDPTTSANIQQSQASTHSTAQPQATSADPGASDPGSKAQAQASNDPAGAIASILGNTPSSNNVAAAQSTGQQSADPGAGGNTAVDPADRSAGGAVASILGNSDLTTAGGGDGVSATQDPGLVGGSPSASTDKQIASQPGAVVVTAQGTAHTVSQVAGSSGLYAVDGSTITAGNSPTVVNGVTVSAGSSGLVIDGTTVPSVQQQVTAASPIVITANEATYTASPVAGSSGYYAVGGTTIEPSASAVVLNGATFSAGSSGLVVDGTTVHDTSDPQQTSNAAATFTEANGETYTATPVAGTSGAYVVGGSTIYKGGSAITSDGVTISAAASGLVVDGSTVGSTPTGTPISGAVLTLGSSTISALETVVAGSDGRVTTEAVLAGSTLVEGALAATIDGHTISFGSSGVLIDGSRTLSISALDPAGTGAVVTLGSQTFTATESIVTGGDGALTTEAVVGGSTLIQGGAPITLGGHTVSFGSSGIVVDGTQTDPLSAMTSSTGSSVRIFTEDGKLVTATAVAGKAGVYVVDGRTISAGGPQEIVDGMTLTAQPSDLVVDGSRTITFASDRTPSITGAASQGSQKPASSPKSTSGKEKSARMSIGLAFVWAAVLTGLLVL